MFWFLSLDHADSKFKKNYSARVQKSDPNKLLESATDKGLTSSRSSGKASPKGAVSKPPPKKRKKVLFGVHLEGTIS